MAECGRGRVVVVMVVVVAVSGPLRSCAGPGTPRQPGFVCCPFHLRGLTLKTAPWHRVCLLFLAPPPPPPFCLSLSQSPGLTPRPFCLQNDAFSFTVSGLSYVTNPPSPPTHCAATTRLSTCSLACRRGRSRYSKRPSSPPTPLNLCPGPDVLRKLLPKTGMPRRIFLAGTPCDIRYCTPDDPDVSSLPTEYSCP